jgi:hypothetical protein
MYVQQRATVVLVGVFYVGGFVDFIEGSMFGAQKCSDHCRELNCNWMFVYLVEVSPY